MRKKEKSVFFIIFGALALGASAIIMSFFSYLAIIALITLACNALGVVIEANNLLKYHIPLISIILGLACCWYSFADESKKA